MISVCLASYNGEQFISEQISSILKQLEEKDEIIISDDGSNDGTIQIIEDINDNRIIFYKNNFKSPTKNFEFLISKAKGEIIVLSDQDDIWQPTKLKRLKYFFLKGFDVVAHNCLLIDEKGEMLSGNNHLKLKKGILNNLYKNSIMGSCLAINKKTLTKILPFPKEIPLHDWWIGLISFKHYKVKIINEPLMFRRIHHNNYSTNKYLKSRLSLLDKIKFRFRLLIQVFIR